MQQPSNLVAGDTIRIISTARKLSKAELQPFVDLLESWNLNVEFGKHLFKEYHQFAGTKEERIQDLQAAIDDKNCKAVFCARGGYGTVQLIDSVDFSIFIDHPKWIVGYSDITVLHNHINQNFGIETIHATMPIDYPNNIVEESVSTLRSALFGDLLSFDFIVEGDFTLGEKMAYPIVGGNLSIVYSLIGTSSQIKTRNKFLFIEDLDEYLYHIDRMMHNLKRTRIFEGCKGVLVGGMNDMNDNAIPFGQTAKEIISESLKDLDIPVLFGLPAGHIKRNLALIMNRKAKLSVEGNKGELVFNG